MLRKTFVRVLYLLLEAVSEKYIRLASLRYAPTRASSATIECSDVLS